MIDEALAVTHTHTHNHTHLRTRCRYTRGLGGQGCRGTDMDRMVHHRAGESSHGSVDWPRSRPVIKGCSSALAISTPSLVGVAP